MEKQIKEVWKNQNGTWSHCMDRRAEFADKTGAQTDLRFCREWQR
jgi:hypothetical protein